MGHAQAAFTDANRPGPTIRRMPAAVPSIRPIALLLALVAAAAHAQQQLPMEPRQPASLHWNAYSQQPPSAQPAASPSQAQAPPRGKVEAASDYMSRMDADGDGRIALSEYVDWMSYAFDARDADRDGVLAAGELPGGKGQPIAREQHRQRLTERFARQDANHDGWLDAQELAAPPR